MKTIDKQLCLTSIFLCSMLVLTSCFKKHNNIYIDAEENYTPTASNILTKKPTKTILTSPPQLQEPKGTSTPLIVDRQPDSASLICQSVDIISWKEIEQLPEVIYAQEYGIGAGPTIYYLHSIIKISDEAEFTAVSPDHTKIAMYDYDLFNVMILGPTGEVLDTIPLVDEDPVIVKWIGLEEILIFSHYYNPVRAYVINVITKEVKEIALDFPDLGQGNNQPGSYWYLASSGAEKSRLVIAPQHDIVLYPTASDFYQTIGEVVLWDLENQVEITRIYGIDESTTQPVFSPDGQTFVMDSMPTITENYVDSCISNIILVDLQGNQKQLTNFESSFRTSYYSWSPDGEQIAFWVNEWPVLGGYLGILDVSTKELKTYCLYGDGEIFWSLNGEYLLITSLDGYNDYSSLYSVSIVNLKDGWVSRVFDEGEALGWIVNDSN